jgi:hypothetical protein
MLKSYFNPHHDTVTWCGTEWAAKNFRSSKKEEKTTEKGPDREEVTLRGGVASSLVDQAGRLLICKVCSYERRLC